MRILLKLVLDCSPDAAWDAIRSPAVFRSVAAPLLTCDSLEPEGFPERWPPGEHRIQATAFWVLAAGDQAVDISYEERADGVRIMRDRGHGISGPFVLVRRWEHSMAVSTAPGGRTLFRDRLVFDAGPLTLALWPFYWVFWQWRALRIRSLARRW